MSHWKKNPSEPAAEPSPSSRNAPKHGCCADSTLLLPSWVTSRREHPNPFRK